MAWLLTDNLAHSTSLEQLQDRSQGSLKLATRAIDDIRYAAEKMLKNVPQANEKRLALHLKAFEISRQIAQQRQFDEESLYRMSIMHHLVATTLPDVAVMT